MGSFSCPVLTVWVSWWGEGPTLVFPNPPHELFFNLLFTSRSLEKGSPLSDSLEEPVGGFPPPYVPLELCCRASCLGLLLNTSPRWKAGEDGSAVSRWHQISLSRLVFARNMLIRKENKGIPGDFKHTRALEGKSGRELAEGARGKVARY